MNVLQPPATILCGETGTGKTSALVTLVKAGIETFVLSTEANGVEALIDAAEREKVNMDLLHWHAATPKAAGWDGLEDMIRKISHMDQQQLASQTNMGKSNHEAAALKFLGQMKDFKCQRTGQCYGDITRWGPDRAFCIDSLTGWTGIAWGCTVGHKPTASPGEWGIGQNFIYLMLKKIIADRNCYFVLTSHLEKENDELTGVKKITVSTLGAKLAPKIPVEFSEVVMTKKRLDQKTGKAEFSWSTLENNAALKNRALPISNNLPADFKPLVDAYERRLKAAGLAPSQSSPAQPSGPATPPVIPAAPAGPKVATS